MYTDIITPHPVAETVYELSKEEKIYPNCGSPLHEMKRTVRTEIEEFHHG